MKYRKLTLGYHLVAYLDVLDQRQKLKTLGLPTTPAEYDQFAAVLSQTAGFICDLREDFREQFAAFHEGLKVNSSQVPAPKLVLFSDSFVVSVPLSNSEGPQDIKPLVGVFSSLTAASSAMSYALANGHALRGGIDVGLGTEIASEEIYGPVLGDAYLLESEKAGYPRILMGEGLWRYFMAAKAAFGGAADQEIRNTIAVIEKLVCQDERIDKERILDYLGVGILEIAMRGQKDKYANDVVLPAYNFVVAEQHKVRDDQKLAPRYENLRSYFESRIANWGISSQD